MENNNVRTMRVYKLHTDVVLPEYATDQSACFDVRAYCPAGTEL